MSTLTDALRDRFAKGVIKLRYPIVVGTLAVVAFFASQLPKAQIEPSIKKQLPADMQARLDLAAIENLFGGTDMIMVTLEADDVLAPETLGRIKKLSRRLERAQGVDRVLSLFTLKEITATDGLMVVDPAVKRIPRTDASREALRKRLSANEIVMGNVVSPDFKAAAIIVMLRGSASDEAAVADVQKLIEEIPGPELVGLAGMPYVRINVSKDIRGDMMKFLPAGVLAVLIFLAVSFRQIRGALLPFTVVVMAVIVGMGLIPLVGWKIQMVTVLLPVILLAVANDYGIHVVARYQEDNIPGSDLSARDLARAGVRALGLPVVATGLTTIAGLLCLMSHIIVPAKELGILASVSVAFALIASLTFVPAVLAILPKSRPVAAAVPGSQTRQPPLGRALRVTASVVNRRPRTVIATVVGVTLAITTGVGRLVVDTNPVNYYPKGSPLERASSLVNRAFGGSTPISVVARGNIKSPEVLKAIDQLEKTLAALPQVGQTTSIAKLVREMNRVMNEERPEEDRIPDTVDAIAQYLLLYSMSGDPEDFDRLVDFPYEHAVVTARINSLSTTQIRSVVDFTRQYLEQNPDEPFTIVGGFAVLFTDLVGAVVRGQVVSLVLSMVLVALLVMAVFRSFWAGLVSVLPLSLAMGALFGLMGYVGIELNIATALLSSIMIGVGVDYTIHFLWRYREERQAGLAPDDAVFATLTTTGRGIIINALSVVVGFSLSLLSSFLPVNFFGFLVVVSITSCLFGALALLPAICVVLRPRFLEPRSA